MLRIVLPKGSLERATLELFDAADLAVQRSSDVDYRATIDDPRIDDVRILRPQEIPAYVAEGLFDLGILSRNVLFFFRSSRFLFIGPSRQLFFCIMLTGGSDISTLFLLFAKP